MTITEVWTVHQYRESNSASKLDPVPLRHVGMSQPADLTTLYLFNLFSKMSMYFVVAMSCFHQKRSVLY